MKFLLGLKSKTKSNDTTNSTGTLFMKSPLKNTQSTEAFVLRLSTVRAYTQGLRKRCSKTQRDVVSFKSLFKTVYLSLLENFTRNFTDNSLIIFTLHCGICFYCESVGHNSVLSVHRSFPLK